MEPSHAYVNCIVLFSHRKKKARLTSRYITITVWQIIDYQYHNQIGALTVLIKQLQWNSFNLTCTARQLFSCQEQTGCQSFTEYGNKRGLEMKIWSEFNSVGRLNCVKLNKIIKLLIFMMMQQLFLLLKYNKRYVFC